MLKSLVLQGVGPAPRLELAPLAPRMNLIAGDNGLGKSFLLEVAWWASTGTWREREARPTRGVKEAWIRWEAEGARKRPPEDLTAFDFEGQRWDWPPGTDTTRDLVLYAVVDGSFGVWDPVRNRVIAPAHGPWTRRPPYLFSRRQVFDGLEEEGRVLCNGLIRDWGIWQGRRDPAFEALERVLTALSPSPQERLSPGQLTRVGLDDVRDHPTLRMPYGQDVPVVLASAAIQRIVSLAYLLVWSWTEHTLACQQTGASPSGRILFLIDELEAHLHPHWQRKVLGALLAVMEALTGRPAPEVQLLAVTHSPLVLASMEPHFDEARDALWVLDLEGREVTLRREAQARHGDANAWLTSDVFELEAPASEEHERALHAAKALLRSTNPTVAELDSVETLLRAAKMSPFDPFLLRWSAFAERVREAAR